MLRFIHVRFSRSLLLSSPWVSYVYICWYVIGVCVPELIAIIDSTTPKLRSNARWYPLSVVRRVRSTRGIEKLYWIQIGKDCLTRICAGLATWSEMKRYNEKWNRTGDVIVSEWSLCLRFHIDDWIIEMIWIDFPEWNLWRYRPGIEGQQLCAKRHQQLEEREEARAACPCRKSSPNYFPLGVTVSSWWDMV